MVEELTNKPQICLHLFSNEKAKNEDHKQVNTNSNPKKIHHAALAKAIWDRNDKEERVCYLGNPAKYVTAVDGKIQR
jgi:hypothetical protein